MTKLAMKREACPLFIASFFFYNKNVFFKQHKKGELMKEIILAKIILYAPAGIVLMLLILTPILTVNLHQIKKIRKRLDNTFEKAEAYLNYIMEEETPEEKAEETKEETLREKRAEKAEEAALLQDVLLEYFS